MLGMLFLDFLKVSYSGGGGDWPEEKKESAAIIFPNLWKIRQEVGGGGRRCLNEREKKNKILDKSGK